MRHRFSFGHLKSHYLSRGGLVGCRLTDTTSESGGRAMDDAVLLHLPLVLSQELKGKREKGKEEFQPQSNIGSLPWILPYQFWRSDSEGKCDWGSTSLRTGHRTIFPGERNLRLSDTPVHIGGVRGKGRRKSKHVQKKILQVQVPSVALCHRPSSGGEGCINTRGDAHFFSLLFFYHFYTFIFIFTFNHKASLSFNTLTSFHLSLTHSPCLHNAHTPSLQSTNNKPNPI
ncbi:MAG: hypothetical protein JOS17DRAFT_232019 [Linnemannia elongata]|nr:MAG: hypothetical protein JOS17DRAFT_232019 [Linnemannia elongata]